MTPEQQKRIEDRLYILKYRTINFRGDTTQESITYTWKERQEALARYFTLKSDALIDDIRFLVAQPEDVDVQALLNHF
jgi:hypothetical protein